jgi:3-(methylsulfanyl)propanoyl-CoA dehydrogenase
MHADDDVKRAFLPKLIDGTWAATICITEANAGSDIGAIETVARRAPDGDWRVIMTKRSPKERSSAARLPAEPIPPQR